MPEIVPSTKVKIIKLFEILRCWEAFCEHVLRKDAKSIFWNEPANIWEYENDFLKWLEVHRCIQVDTCDAAFSDNDALVFSLKFNLSTLT